MKRTEFVPGRDLCRGFFADHVKPVLADGFAELRYSAALIGAGSEVLGFDTPMSTDHHWGPRAMLFLTPRDYARHGDDIRGYLARELPPEYRGYPTHFSPPDPDDNATQVMVEIDDGPINHRVELFTIDGFFSSYMGLNIAVPMTSEDWLSLPFQKLRSIAAGDIYRDDLGLGSKRKMLSWYPRDVWLYLLGCCWTRIAEEEHLMGRAGFVGDELGSALIGGRLARNLMWIAFLLEEEYPPYPKWFGTAFNRLKCSKELKPYLERAVRATAWQDREEGLVPAFETLVRMQRERDIDDGGSGRAGMFWGRPFRVIHGDKIAAAVFSRIEDDHLAGLARKRPIGNIDLVSDSTDVLEDPSLRDTVGRFFML